MCHWSRPQATCCPCGQVAGNATLQARQSSEQQARCTFHHTVCNPLCLSLLRHNTHFGSSKLVAASSSTSAPPASSSSSPSSPPNLDAEDLGRQQHQGVMCIVKGVEPGTCGKGIMDTSCAVAPGGGIGRMTLACMGGCRRSPPALPPPPPVVTEAVSKVCYQAELSPMRVVGKGWVGPVGCGFSQK